MNIMKNVKEVIVMNKIKKIVNIIKILKIALDVKTVDEVEEKLIDFYTEIGVIGEGND